jgi:hypothetical protein
LGQYPAVTLTKARSQALDILSQIKKGEDPRENTGQRKRGQHAMRHAPQPGKFPNKNPANFQQRGQSERLQQLIVVNKQLLRRFNYPPLALFFS